MLTISAAQQGVLNAGVQAEYVRVQVKDSGGTWRDLTTYPGFNAVKSVTWKESVDSPHATFTIVLFRELYGLSLSPYMGGSALNRGFDPTASPVALLALNRELKIECAVVAMDTAPSSGDWFEVFHGRIDTIDPAQDKTVQLEGRALSGRLAQQYIKVERVYSYAVDGGLAVALRVWEPNQVYAAGEYILPSSRGDSDPGFNKFLKVRTGGTSGTTEPIWTTGAGQTDGTCVHDYIGTPTTLGNPVEQVMQNILDNNKGTGDSTVTLYVPTSPLWQITEFIQQREFTLDAVLALAQQLGWDTRYKWRSGTAQFEFTLYQPQRSSPSVLYTFASDDYATPTQLKVDIATIRNRIRVWYGDASDLWPDGTPKRKPIEVADSGSITKYGELWMEIQEDQTSQIDSSTEASALANAALSDLKEPTAELDVPLMGGFPWVEINDYYTFTANGLHFDSDQSLAVVGFQHQHENGKLKTQLQTRGLPTIGADTWLKKRVNPRVPPKFKPHQQVQFNGTKTPAVAASSIVGGQQLVVTQTFDKNGLAEEYEHHIYTTPGTTPSSATFAALTKDRVHTPANLIAGKTYYHVVIPRWRNAEKLIVGTPCAETSFVAGQAAAGHIQDGIALGDYPLNGGFETQQDPSGMPDHWTMYSGALGTDAVVMNDTNGISGSSYMRLKGGGIRSAVFPIINEAMESNRRGGLYRFAWWRKSGSAVSGGATMSALIRLLDYAGAEVDILTVAGSIAVDDVLSHWVKHQLFVQLRAGDPSARALQLQLTGGTTTANHHLDIDDVRCQYLGTPWFQVGDTTNHTDRFESIPGFDNTYQAFNTGTDTIPAFRRNHRGRVFIEGAFKHATTSKVGFSLFTLPASFCPPLKRSFPVTANGQHGLVEISTGGAVTLVSADNANPSTKIVLDSISFETHNIS